MTKIVLQHVTRTFGSGDTQVRALNDISTEFQHGSLIALMGPSGSGKTTMLNMIGALDCPDSGTILLNNHDVGAMSDGERAVFRRGIGFIFQRFALIPTASAYENIEFALRIADVPRPVWQERIMHTLTQLDIVDHAHHRPNELSGGQQQRVAIARALAIHPQLLLADEPTANLDAQRGAAVLTLFTELCQSGITIVMSTHDPAAERYASHVCRMRSGQVERIDVRATASATQK
jgi:ABC-type lipoprotein export system ATPase subunit